MHELPPVMRWALVGFATSFVLLHIAVYEKWGKKAFWLCLDYVWLLVAFAGVLSAAVEVRTWLARKRVDDTAQRYSTWRADSLHEATWEAGSLDNYNFSNWQDEKRKVAEPEYKRVADWYRDGAEALKAEGEKAWMKFYKNRCKAELSADPTLKQSQEIFVDKLKTTYEAWTDQDELKQAADRNELERDLWIVSPFFLGLAIGIRFSKVSAQLRKLC